MSKLNYESYNNGYLQSSVTPTSDVKKGLVSGTNRTNNLNYIYISPNSPTPLTHLNSVSSNTYSSYDTKLSSNNSKTSNVSSSNESSLLNNNSSYHSNNDDMSNYSSNLDSRPSTRYQPAYDSTNYYDHRYSSYTPISHLNEITRKNSSPSSYGDSIPPQSANSNKKVIKIKNMPNNENSNLLRNQAKITNEKLLLNSLNKRHSVNIDSYPSTPRSNLSTPPVPDSKTSNEKLLSYSYYSNQNYDKPQKKDSGKYFYDTGTSKVKFNESAYSGMTGNMNKDRKAKSINNVSSGYKGLSSTGAQQESPLYQKIMTKLSELPDSLLMRTSAQSQLSSTPALNYDPPQKTSIPIKNPLGEIQYQSKPKGNLVIIKKPSVSTTPTPPPPSTPTPPNQKYVSTIEIMSNEPVDKELLFNKLNKDNRRTKHKSMYIETSYNDDFTLNSKNTPSESLTNQHKDLTNTSAGDLIFTNSYYTSGNLVSKTSNPTYRIQDYLYSDETSKIIEDPLHDNAIKDIARYCSTQEISMSKQNDNNIDKNTIYNDIVEKNKNSSSNEPKVYEDLVNSNNNSIQNKVSLGVTTSLPNSVSGASNASSVSNHNNGISKTTAKEVINTKASTPVNAYVKIFDQNSNDNKYKRYSKYGDLELNDNKDHPIPNVQKTGKNDLTHPVASAPFKTQHDTYGLAEIKSNYNQIKTPISSYYTTEPQKDQNNNKIYRPDTSKDNDTPHHKKQPVTITTNAFTQAKNNNNKEFDFENTEEIERAATFGQSSESYTDSELDSTDFDDNNDPPIKKIDIKKLKDKSYELKKLNFIPIPDKVNTAKIISNYPAISSTPISFDKEKTPLVIKQITVSKNGDELKHVNYVSNDMKNCNTRLRSKDYDAEISEINSNGLGNHLISTNSNKSAKSDKDDVQLRAAATSLRKISTPPPLPHLVDSKSKRNSLHMSENTNQIILTPKPDSDKVNSKPSSITSAIRESKLDKPMRVSHGLPPPPPPSVSNRQSLSSTPTPSLPLNLENIQVNNKISYVNNSSANSSSSASGNKADIRLRKLITPTPVSNQQQQSINGYAEVAENFFRKQEPSTKDPKQKLVNDDLHKKLFQDRSPVRASQGKEVIIKNSKKDENKQNTSTNLPQLDKIDYVLKTNDDKLLTNILPYQEDKKASNNSKNKSPGKSGIPIPVDSSTKKTVRQTNNNAYDPSKIDPFDDPWNAKEFKNGKNFYENYARENDRRKREGNGFLMLLPGIAIPIDTDAGESDGSSSN